MTRSIIVAALTSIALSGCASDSANMHIGDEQPYSSLADQRDAARHITVSDNLPVGAATIGIVTASRCHRYLMDNPPTEADVRADLMVAAYAKGADGIANINIETNVVGGLLKDCWHTLVGTATAYRNG